VVTVLLNSHDVCSAKCGHWYISNDNLVSRMTIIKSKGKGRGAWNSVVVKALTTLLVGGSRDRSLVVSLGNFSEATDGTMCPGVDSASKNEYQETSGGKDVRCVRVTTLPPSWCRKSRRSRNLNLPDPQGPARPVAGKLYLYLKIKVAL
jgi:hypothetical protein